jgi:predicted RNA-binding protein with TRAM domain
MGCQHYGDRGGAEWCNHYDMPIHELKSQPVKPGEEVVIDIEDMHESGAGVGRTEDGFIVLVDGLLPPSRARVRIDRVKSNHARGEEVERLPMDDDEEAEVAAEGEETAVAAEKDDRRIDRERLGSRDNFWGG